MTYDEYVAKVKIAIDEIGEQADVPVWGHGHTDPNDPTVTCKMYSFRDLYNELVNKTEMGMKHYESYLDMEKEMAIEDCY